MRWWMIATTAVLLSGCSSISKEECLQGDWYSLGVNDGKQGKLAAGSFSDYKKECAEHGVSPDFKTYQQGHQQGLVFYCDYAHGEAHGRSGADYNTACTGPLEANFRQGYQQGRQWYVAKKRVDDVASAIDRLQRDNSMMDDEIYEINQRIIAEQDPSQRASLTYRSDRLRQQIAVNAAEIGRLTTELRAAERAFAPFNRQP